MKYKSGIYKLLNIITNDFYIGQTINFQSRKGRHFYEFRKGIHKNKYLQNAFNKYGGSNFKFEIIFYCEPFELTKYEQFFVDILKPAYNLCVECVDSCRGIEHDDEFKQNISKRMKEYWNKRLLGKRPKSDFVVIKKKYFILKDMLDRMSQERFKIFKNYSILPDALKLKSLYNLYELYKKRESFGITSYKYFLQESYKISDNIQELANLGLILYYDLGLSDAWYFAGGLFYEGIIKNIEENCQDKTYVPFQFLKELCEEW